MKISSETRCLYNQSFTENLLFNNKYIQGVVSVNECYLHEYRFFNIFVQHIYITVFQHNPQWCSCIKKLDWHMSLRVCTICMSVVYRSLHWHAWWFEVNGRINLKLKKTKKTANMHICLHWFSILKSKVKLNSVSLQNESSLHVMTLTIVQ